MTRVDNLPKFVEIGEPVAIALTEGQPIVALESTIITHGMPFPENTKMALSVEKVVSDGGAVPATIAVIDGCLKIGLTAAELGQLAQQKDAMKVSRADIAYAISAQKSAGTTVAATMIAAQLVGIKVFATGGIGGVHKGAEETFDISADLTEFGRTNMIVVAAGAKAILDVPKTLEVLETEGVPVVGYRTDTLPAFWSSASDLPVPLRLDSAQEIAGFQKVRDTLGLKSGLLVANPIPVEDEIPAHVMKGYIEKAEEDRIKQGITGKEVTPFMLQRIYELSGGDSLKANIALVKNNAQLASQIAVCLLG